MKALLSVGILALLSCCSWAALVTEESRGTTLNLFWDNATAEEAIVTTNNSSSIKPTQAPSGSPTAETTPEETVEEEVVTSVQRPASTAPRIATGFSKGQPFNFTNIFFVGGECGMPDKDNWYSKFVLAGYNTIKPANPTTNVQIICAPGGMGVYTRDYHVWALEQIELKAGDKLNKTLVITAAVNMDDDWDMVADLMKKGMAFFHAREDITKFNMTDFGLVPEEVLYFYFRWDEESSAERAGKEICRLKGGNNQAQFKVAKVYGRQRYRIDAALRAFNESCPETEVVVLWEMEAGEFESYKTTLQFNPLPDVIFTCEDAQAYDILLAAKEVLPEDEYSRLTTTGWDNIQRDLLDSRKILTTVDQLVHYPDRGLWKVVGTVIDLITAKGLNSTVAVQETLLLGNDTLTIDSETLTISSDKVGFLITNLLQGYDTASPPSAHIPVHTGLHDVTITNMIPFEGKFETVLWLKVSWRDPRLSWNPSVHTGIIPLSSEQIWTPKLHFKNEFDSDLLFLAPAMVSPDGTVVMETNLNAVFLCSTTEDLRSFPFDHYECSMDLGAPIGVILDQDWGFEVIESDPHFVTNTSMAMGVGDGGDGHAADVAFYKLTFDRRSFTAWVRLIIPAVLINLVGFMAFWIPEVQESVALGITSLLCSLAFRETVDMPDTADVTWTEVFMMINIGYQASVMFIIWLSYGGTNQLASTVDACFQRCHPKKGIRRGKVRAQQAARSVSKSVKSMDISTIGDISFSDALRRRKRTKAELEHKMRAHGAPENDFVDIHSNDFPTIHDIPGTIPSNGATVKAYWSSSDEEEDFHTSLASFAEEEIAIPPFSPKKSSTVRDNFIPSFSREESFSVQDIAMARPEAVSRARRQEFDQSIDLEDDYVKRHTDITKGSQVKRTNVDWIGRWFIVPSYVIIMTTLLANGWGFF